MFIGHFAVGFGSKRPAPAVSLGTLFLAAQFLDLLWPSLVLLGAIASTPVLDLKPVMTELLPRGEIRQPLGSHELMRDDWRRR